MQRRHGNPILPNRMKICPRSGIRFGARRTYPVNRIAMWIGRFDHRFGLVAVAETRRLKPGQLFVRNVRDIHVQDGIGRQWMILEFFEQAEHDTRGRRKLPARPAHQRHGDCRQSEEAPFHGGGDRA